MEFQLNSASSLVPIDCELISLPKCVASENFTSLRVSLEATLHVKFPECAYGTVALIAVAGNAREQRSMGVRSHCKLLACLGALIRQFIIVESAVWAGLSKRELAVMQRNSGSTLNIGSLYLSFAFHRYVKLPDDASYMSELTCNVFDTVIAVVYLYIGLHPIANVLLVELDLPSASVIAPTYACYEKPSVSYLRVLDCALGMSTPLKYVPFAELSRYVGSVEFSDIPDAMNWHWRLSILGSSILMLWKATLDVLSEPGCESLSELRLSEALVSSDFSRYVVLPRTCYAPQGAWAETTRVLVAVAYMAAGTQGVGNLLVVLKLI